MREGVSARACAQSPSTCTTLFVRAVGMGAGKCGAGCNGTESGSSFLVCVFDSLLGVLGFSESYPIKKERKKAKSWSVSCVCSSGPGLILLAISALLVLPTLV